MRKRLLLGTLLFTVFLIVGCTSKSAPKFDGTPTAVTGEAVGTIVLNAQKGQDSGEIHYVVVDKDATAPTASEVAAGVNYGSVTVVAHGSAASLSNVSVALTAGTEYAVYFVVKDGSSYSVVLKALATAKEATTLGFTAMAVATGDEDGELKVNIQKSGSVGTIYYVLVEEGALAPTAAQIIAGVNYGSVTLVSSGNAAQFTNYVISDLTPGARYTLYTVISHESNTSIVRNMTATAKETIIIVDKGDGTESNPFQISTIQDLLQIGQGYYLLDEKEWNMDSHYVLLNDIDLSEQFSETLGSWPVLGADAAGARFAGVFDGNGFTISNLYIGSDSVAGAYRGFFASSEPTAVVKNLTFDNAYVQGAGIGEENANHGTGVLYGYFKGTVQHVQILNATVTDTGTRVGGLGGRSYETGHVYDTYVNATVTGVNRVGGFVGVIDVADGTPNPIIYQNVVFDGQVIGQTQHIGGIGGYVRGVNMSNVFVTGYIQGGQETGGVVGFYQKRGGNNNVSAIIENAVVYATVLGTTQTTTIGAVVGQRSTSGITEANAGMLVVQNIYHVEGTNVVGGGDTRAFNGDMVSQADFGSSTWLSSNLPSFDFTGSWELSESHDRPVLRNTVDLGVFGELSTPLILLPSFVTGPEEKQITLNISANKVEATIYYVIHANNTLNLTLAELISGDVEGKLFSGNDASVLETFTFDNFNQAYTVYFAAVAGDESTDVYQLTATSKGMTPLVVEGGLRPGNANREIHVNLTTNLSATIYYIIVAEEGVYTKEMIKTPSGVLASGQGASVDQIHLMPLEGTQYFLYAYAEASDRDSDVVTSNALSNSDEIVNYGSGTLADPFIIRTVTDLENIGKGTYINEDSVDLNYANNAHYILANDIDLTQKYGEGKLNWTPLGDFFGTIDGNDFTIYGLYINAPTQAGHNAFISYLRNDAVVKNLAFDQVYINVQGALTDGNNGMTGVVAGRMNSSRVENITITNAVVHAVGFRVGAIAGGTEGSNSHFTNIYIEADVQGWARVGGVVGNVSNSSAEAFNVTNAVFIGSVRATGNSDFRVGGIAGWARGLAVHNAYVEGTISGPGAIAGGVVGYLENFSSTTQFAAVTSTLVNVVVISENLNRAGSILGSVSSDSAKIPTLLHNYQTQATTLITTGSTRTDVRNATVVANEDLTQVWFETNMPAFFMSDAWVMGVNRPKMDNGVDLGLVNALNVPLLYTASFTTGTQEKEIKLNITTNKPEAVITYLVATEGTFTQEDVLLAELGGAILFVGSGALINETLLMPDYGTSYVVAYVIQDGDDVVFAQSNVTSGAEVALTFDASAVTGEVTPGDIVLNVTNPSHASTIYYAAVLSTEPALTKEDVLTLNQLITAETTLTLAAGEAYVVYFYGVKDEGTLDSALVTVEVNALASPEADFEVTNFVVENTAVNTELALTVATSHPAHVYALILLASEVAPSNEDVITLGTLIEEGTFTFTELTPGTDYVVYIVAQRVDVIEEVTLNQEVSTPRALYNGENTASYFPIYALEDLEAYRDGINEGTISNTSTLEFKTDIDMSETYGEDGLNWFPIGTNTRKYKGEVIGNHHTVNGLYIVYDNANNNEGVGFFGTTDAGFVIHNFHLTNVNVTGGFSVGALVGYAKITHLSNVSVDGGTVTGTQADTRVGGLVGRFNSGGTADSILELAWTNVTVLGVKSVGGLVGHVDYSSDTAVGELIIRDVYTLGSTTGTLSTNSQVGGVVGYHRATLIRGVAYGTVTGGATENGGVVGYTQNRHQTAGAPYAKVMDSIAANGMTVIGRVQTDRGEVTVSGNLLVVASDPQSNEIVLSDLLDTANWGTLVPLNETNWKVENNQAILK